MNVAPDWLASELKLSSHMVCTGHAVENPGGWDLALSCGHAWDEVRFNDT